MSSAQRLDDLSVLGRAILEPSGNHALEIVLDGSAASILLGRQQVRELRGLIESFEREMIFRDGGPDLQRRVFAPLEGGK